MSFILDALRKADARRGGPDTPDLPSLPAEAPVASATFGLLRMAAFGSVLLLVGVAAVVWLVSRPSAPGNGPAALSTVVPAESVTQAAAGSSPTVRAPVTVREPDVRPLDREVAAANAVRAPRSGPAAAALGGSGSGAGDIALPSTSAGVAKPVKPGRVVYSDEPLDAAVAAWRPATTALARKPRGPDSDLIMYSQFAVNDRSGAPPLRLDVHVYSDDPSSRFVFVNMRKYREGDRLKGDIRIDRITPDGAVLSLRGQRFLLPRS